MIIINRYTLSEFPSVQERILALMQETNEPYYVIANHDEINHMRWSCLFTAMYDDIASERNMGKPLDTLSNHCSKPFQIYPIPEGLAWAMHESLDRPAPFIDFVGFRGQSNCRYRLDYHVIQPFNLERAIRDYIASHPNEDAHACKVYLEQAIAEEAHQNRIACDKIDEVLQQAYPRIQYNRELTYVTRTQK